MRGRGHRLTRAFTAACGGWPLAHTPLALGLAGRFAPASLVPALRDGARRECRERYAKRRQPAIPESKKEVISHKHTRFP